MSENSEEWELSKENIKPIQQGRKPKVLKVALASHPEDIILQQRQSFENELRTYSGDDPLVVWCEYIKWVEQNFPKGGREGHIKELIERCLSILKNENKYYDDNRFVDIMLKYAVLSGKPIDVYNYMFSNNIGCKSAKLFINWSFELEQMSNFKKADDILIEGIQRRAEPFEKVHSYYKDFEIRLAGKIKADVAQNNCESENNRSAFAMLKPQKNNLAPVLRIGEAVIENKKMPLLHGRQQPQPKSINASVKVPFKIFNSKSSDSSLPVQSLFNNPGDLTSESYKENERKPSKWSKVKVKPHGLHLKTPNEAKPGFIFHCDNDVEQEFQTPRSVPSTSKVLTTRCRTPTSPMAFFETSDPLVKNMYPKNKIYGGAEEFSLEEIRAAEWFDQRKKTEQEVLSEQQKGIEESQKRKEALEEKVEGKKVELLENHGVSSPEFKTDINKSESIMNENTLYKMPHEENFDNSHLKNYDDSHFKHNFDIFSFNTTPSTNICMPGPFGEEYSISSYKAAIPDQNVGNKTELCSIKEDVCHLNSNKELSEKFTAAYSKNFLSDINEANPHEQTQSSSKKSDSNLSFAFYHDPINE